MVVSRTVIPAKKWHYSDLPEDDDDSDGEGAIFLPSPTRTRSAHHGGHGGHHKAGAAKETLLSITCQILFPFLVAGMGMVAAGLVLDWVQHWKVFETVSKLFILIPALLGLKGNLEMTLASRLSTHANLGNLDTKEGSWSMVIGNLALVQVQAIVVGLLAAVFAIIIGYIPEHKFDPDHALLLCAASILTASVASFILALVMVGVIMVSRRFGINPDNVATPIAASLGDLTTLLLLALTASALYSDLSLDRWLAPAIIGSYVFITPLCVYVARSNESTRQVLYYGWVPVLLAMVISSLGGMVLDMAIARFTGIAVFQPIINGVGGNLVAVQASRISTSLHSKTNLGMLPKDDHGGRVCAAPWAIFVGGEHAKTARILLALVVPGHALFTLAVHFLEAGHTSLTPQFLGLYLTAAVLQVWLLLFTAHWLTRLLWKRRIDPDNSAIPYLTALGDLLGGLFLWTAFECLFLLSGMNSSIGNVMQEVGSVGNATMPE